MRWREDTKQGLLGVKLGLADGQAVPTVWLRMQDDTHMAQGKRLQKRGGLEGLQALENMAVWRGVPVTRQ